MESRAALSGGDGDLGPPESLYAIVRRNVPRAILIAVVVGTLLVLINHGDHIEEEPVCAGFFAKCALSYAVPFMVSIVSAVWAARSRSRSG